jgi:hypothetical protein
MNAGMDPFSFSSHNATAGLFSGVLRAFPGVFEFCGEQMNQGTPRPDYGRGGWFTSFSKAR